jgi:hypothetical protein
VLDVIEVILQLQDGLFPGSAVSLLVEDGAGRLDVDGQGDEGGARAKKRRPSDERTMLERIPIYIVTSLNFME